MRRVGPEADSGGTAGGVVPKWFDILLRAQALGILGAILTGLLLTFVGLPLARDVFRLGCGPALPSGDHVCADGLGYGAGGLLCCALVAVVVFAVTSLRGARARRMPRE
ncbi:hypothetical protein OCAE111667_07380 [Occultella aeris]|uniref:Uncharacterized protein n=1 Tax=Occultella aeris TaxID=2761496 RepID=A0A7M4DPE8_9MICO|nr:hypothetical protein [Occultella aeris]VZO39334.1 hypothetical protein HALOF300_04030 [Occultella aeris]